MPQYPGNPNYPPAATPQETQDFLAKLLSMTALKDSAALPPPPAAAPPPAGGLGGLVGLARSSGRGIENNQAPGPAAVVEPGAAPAARGPARGRYNGEPHPTQAGWWWDETAGRYMRARPK